MDEVPVTLLFRHPQMFVDRGGHALSLGGELVDFTLRSAELLRHGRRGLVGAHIDTIGAQHRRARGDRERAAGELHFGGVLWPQGFVEEVVRHVLGAGAPSIFVGD